jgi:hypothetical protein
MLSSKFYIALYALIAILAIAPTAASAQTGRPVGPTMCACPGAHKPLGNNRTCEDACFGSRSSSSSPSGTSGGSIGTIIGTEIGKELGKALFGDPEADAIRKAEQELERRRAEEQALKQQEESKNRLLGNMIGVDNSPPLGLIGVESSPGLSLMTDSPSANQARSTAYSKGFEHASQCISQNAGSSCAGVTAEQQQACVADYRAGYDSGSQQKALVLQEAYQAGRSAASRGELANAASDQRAQGQCRIEWIESYNRGHFQGKN